MVFSNLFFIYLFLPLNLILYFISSNKNLAQWGAVGFFPLFLCVGRAGVGVYADAHRLSGLHLGKVHRIFSPERAEPPDEAGAGSLAAV